MRNMNDNVSFYDFMNMLDEFTITEIEEYDFRDLTVHSNKIIGNEVIYIKNKEGKVITTFVLNK